MFRLIFIWATSVCIYYGGTLDVVTGAVWYHKNLDWGPLLFLIYINDLPINAQNCQIAANMLKMRAAERYRFQFQLEPKVVNAFIISKYFIIAFTKRNNPLPFNYCINGTTLKLATQVRDWHFLLPML